MPNCFFFEKEKRLHLGHPIVNFLLCGGGSGGGVLQDNLVFIN